MDTSTYPPDSGLAIGPNYAVMIEGAQIEWTNLTGGSPTVQSVYSFFSPLSPTGGLYDQSVVYDGVNQRFVVIMQYLAPDGATADIDVAVSKDSNPNDGWTFSQLNTTVTINGQSTVSDRPMLAVDGSNVYISAAQYNTNVSGYAGTENWIIGDKAGAGGGIYGGGALSVTTSEVMPSAQGIFAVASGNNGKTYYASDFSSGGQIVVALQTYDKATNTFSATGTVNLGNIDQGGSDTAQQRGTSLLLDAGDNRIASMAYANGFLYAVAEMKPTGSSVPLVHWLKIDVSNPSAPALVAQGDISGAVIGTGVATFNPSIAVDAAGDVLINFTASGPNMYPADYYVFQGGSDPVGSFSAPTLYQASTGFFNAGDGASVQSWGVNSSATVDPNNPYSFWISNEYVASGWWQTSVAKIAIQNSTATGPAVSSIVASGTGITNGAGDLNAGKVVTLTVNFSAAVTVNTGGGTPTLVLNDGGTASYTGGSGSTALTFSYTVAAGQNTADLVISSFNLNGATVTDGTGNAANLTGAINSNPAGILQIDTTAPTIASIVATGTGVTNGSGTVSAGQVVTLTVNLSEAVTVNTSAGSPTLGLNDGGTATYTGGSGSAALTFGYTVAAGQTTSDLVISSFNLNGAVVSDGAGNTANLAGATNYNPAGTLQVNPTVPTVASIAATGTGITGGAGDLNAGKVVTLTVNFSAAVTVTTSGGTPSLTLNDGGTASYTGGSGSTALTFSYTVAAGQTTSDLVISALNLNGATITGGNGNAANLTGATNSNPAGILQIDTTAPTIASIAATGTGVTNGSGSVSTGQVVTLTVNLSEAVTVNTSAGSPTLSLNDGGTATYTGGSGSAALTFSYTVAAGQTTADLAIPSFNLNGAVVSDGAGNAANLAGATNYNPAGTLQVNPTAPTVASIAATGTGITGGAGDLNAGKVVTLTVNFSASVTVTTSGGTPSLTLNDGGTASYTGGSGSTALTFSYTVAAGQNTADLVISSFNLNGATITGGNGNAANLTGATNSNPVGILQIDTTAPTIASIAATGTGITDGSGSVSTGQVVTLTVNLSEAVTVNTTSGTPTLALNDGGTASYVSGSGSTALTFRYTVAAGQITSDLAISSFNLNGAVVSDGAGNAANLAGAANYNPAGTLQVNPTTTTTGVPKYSHIVVVVEENHNYDQIAGNSQAPYINSLMAGGASLTNMTAEAHPSQPNYFVLYAGSTFGTTDDNSYSLPDPTLYTVLKNGGYSFTGYVDEGGIGSDYNHDPWVSFPEGRTVQTDFTSFPALFANGNYSSLPTVSFVIPSVSDDMHSGTIAQGDTWLQQNLSAYAQWAVNNNSLLVVTWDENDDSTSEAASNTIPTLLYGANVVPGNYGTAYNHDNLLSTITASLGLTAPNDAATAAPIQVFGTAAGAAALTVDQDGVAESPALAINSNSLTVQAGGSVALGITATPVDSDDQLSLRISGLPSYESITAPAGNTVASSLQSDGTYTWTVTEGSSTTGRPLTELTLSSSYTGTDHPVATFTVTASNTTAGETATSASKTMTVTDPPAPSPGSPNVALSQDAGAIDRLAALMNQFAAAGFRGNSFGPSPPTHYPNVGWGDPNVLAAAHLHAR
nr:alkaline phosphatase family protein [Bradyrhizobium sp. Oc8]